jgi:hypothetical protein
MLSNHDIDLLVENSTYRISKVLCVILNLTHLIYLSRIDQRSLMFYPASQIASQGFLSVRRLVCRSVTKKWDESEFPTRNRFT